MKKKTKKKCSEAEESEVKYYVMYGFEEANPDNTAYLKIAPSGSLAEGDPISGPYYAVSEAGSATVFPSSNVFKKKGFGTPYQWAEYFAEEEELQDWNFHPVPFNFK